MLDYLAKLISAYNQVEAATSAAARAMDKTKVKNKQVFTHLMQFAVSEEVSEGAEGGHSTQRNGLRNSKTQ